MALRRQEEAVIHLRRVAGQHLELQQLRPDELVQRCEAMSTDIKSIAAGVIVPPQASAAVHHVRTTPSACTAVGCPCQFLHTSNAGMETTQRVGGRMAAYLKMRHQLVVARAAQRHLLPLLSDSSVGAAAAGGSAGSAAAGSSEQPRLVPTRMFAALGGGDLRSLLELSESLASQVQQLESMCVGGQTLCLALGGWGVCLGTCTACYCTQLSRIHLLCLIPNPLRCIQADPAAEQPGRPRTPGPGALRRPRARGSCCGWRGRR